MVASSSGNGSIALMTSLSLLYINIHEVDLNDDFICLYVRDRQIYSLSIVLLISPVYAGM